MKIDTGECFGLLGSNGSGKSTVLRLLTGMIRPDQGNIKILKSPIRICQQHDYFVDELTPDEHISMALELGN